MREERHRISHILAHGESVYSIKKKRQRGDGQREIVYRSYVDALWTVHLAGREAVTVSSGLADNMAKGIHLERWGTRRQKEWSDKSWG